jgi:hypothetical protein
MPIWKIQAKTLHRRRRTIARLSPYKTEHINRFGHYELRFDHIPPPVTEELRLSPTSLEVAVIC